MEKLTREFIVFIIIQIALIAQASADSLAFSFVSPQTTILRTSDLTQPQSIPAGSVIRIDSEYLRQYLGTENPTQDQIQKLLLNPGEATRGRLVTQRFRNIGSRRSSADFFFDVSVVEPNGEIKTGSMALQYYYRSGFLSLRRSDGVDPSRDESPETAARRQELVDDNQQRPVNTEAQAQVCVSCDQSRAGRNPVAPLTDIVRSADQSLWNDYQSFAREFTRQHPRITRANAGRMKREFVRGLIDRFGIERAAKMMEALTAFGEAPYRRDDNTQRAELAAIMKVVENRANSNYSHRSRTLRDIGVSVNTNALMTNILADSQFSAWNDRDNSLVHMLSFNPDRTDSGSRKRMRLAFESEQMMSSGRITFAGQMNDSRVRHYHANYVSPRWGRRSARIQNATVVVDGVNVNLSNQSGARHIFYVGL